MSRVPAGSIVIIGGGHAAAQLCASLQSRSEPDAALPWFWSEQGSLRLQMAGLEQAADTPGLAEVPRPGATSQNPPR